MKELHKLGYTQEDIAKKFGVSRTAVRYHIDSNFRETVKQHSAERKKLPEVKEKARIRMNERYKKEKAFRENAIRRSMLYNQTHKEKKKEINKRYWQNNKERLLEERRKKRLNDIRDEKKLIAIILIVTFLISAAIYIMITGG